MNRAALKAFGGENDPLFQQAGGGQAKAGRTNVVRAFAGPPVSARLIHAVCELRQERSRVLPGELLGEPAWDILLRLYAAELDQQRMSISRLTRLSAIPATTVLRFLGRLADAGLVARVGDPMDNRRVFVSLSADGIERMNRFFAVSGLRSVVL